MLTDSVFIRSRHSYIEGILDVIPHVSSFLTACVFSPVGCIARVIRMPFDIMALVMPKYVEWYYTQEYTTAVPREITILSIEKKFYEQTKLPKGVQDISREKLHRALDMTKQIAKKLGITQEIKVYSTENLTVSGTVGSQYTLTAIPVYLSPKDLDMSDAALAFVIAHELSHVVNNDCLKSIVVSISILALEVLACIFLTPFVIPLIEGIAIVYTNYACRSREMAADLRAMKILGSGEGAIEGFSKFIQANKVWRVKDERLSRRLKERYPCFNLLSRVIYWISKDVIVTYVSPEGDYRYDLTHPRHSQRLQAAIDFKPTPARNTAF